MTSQNLWTPDERSEILSELEESECWETTIEFEDRSVGIDINIEEEPLDLDLLEQIEDTILRLDELNASARDAIRRNHDDPSMEYGVRLYKKHHLSELDSGTLSQCFQQSDPARVSDEDFLKALHIARVGFYPEDDEHFTVVDYTLGRSLTDYLIVVNCDDKRRVVSIAVES